MAAASRVRLLLVDGSPTLGPALTGPLDAAGLRYRLGQAASRQEFFKGLERPSPDLILAGEKGASGLALEEILEAARALKPGIPVVVLGERSQEASAIRILRKGAWDYLRLIEIERLPSVVERALRDYRAGIRQLRMEDEVQRVAGLMRENQRLATIGRLASSIAHEINNPLESISNLLFLIEHEPGLPAAARSYLELAQGELERVVQISKQTLNFYREAPAALPVRPSMLLDEVLVLYARRIAEKHLEVVREFESDDAAVMFPGEMRQVFSNLITNAIEASSENGKLRLRVRNARCSGDSGIVGMRVTIADSGVGMTPEVRRHIGKPFFTTKGQGGTGLGLWVTQSILGRYGGALLIRSSAGKRHGTVFSVFLPTNLRPRVVPRRPAEPRSFMIEMEADGVEMEAGGGSSAKRGTRQRAKGA